MNTKMFEEKNRQCKAEKIEYRLYTFLLLPIACLAVILRRMFFTQQRFATGTRPSFLGEVLELNRSTVPWIFMGR